MTASTELSAPRRGEVPQFRIKVDREKAKMYSLTLEQIYQAVVPVIAAVVYIL